MRHVQSGEVIVGMNPKDQINKVLCPQSLIMLVWLFLLPASNVAATGFQAEMDESSWSVDSSVFACRLNHEIPFYGQAVFEHLAGESAQFLLNSRTPRLETGKASIIAKNPLWKPNAAAVDLGYVAVSRGAKPIVLDNGRSERLLSVLYEGRDVVFTRAPWYGAEESTRVILSPVNFQVAYERYLSCLSGLLPVNFEQIRRTAIYFPSGSEELSSAQIKKLDNIAIYVKADDSVKSFYIDGHTDSVGPREDNLELSKLRAEMVMRLLVERGVPEEKIVSRWHGERYPVSSNRTAKGRSENRRVTIRLEKVVDIVVPSLASAE